METTTFELQGEFIELCNLLKLAGIANSGGQGKVMVSDGIVQVDGNIETRRTAKIRSGQVVECLGQTVKVL
ncbi:RNA-binding protein [Methylotenera oryzisoli]|jgi:ribosome-associated protein|uniref:RNA-binding protein n=2 Tax=Methylotenera TaxID=359407 RepID=A0A4Y9VQ21_9PROT|nr:RNA-binding S4 domain-containing protein [Methylotenera oryzisoli]TFW70968.1 RNA-binding protein [Methylotenera oryzisoli]HBA08831.1 RNA-binding protein [Methylotenera mobilis]